MDETSAVPGALAARWLRGMGAGLVGHFVSLLSRIALPPLFLYAWGVNLYGEWLVLTAFAAHLFLSDLGGGLYAVNRMTQEFAVGNTDGLRRTLQTALAIFTVWPVILALVFATVMWILPVRTFFGVTVMGEDTARLLLTVLAVQITVLLPQELLLGVFRAVGQLPRGLMFANLLQFLQLAAVSVGLWGGAGPVSIGMLQLAPQIFIACWVFRLISREFPDLELLSWKDSRMNTAKEFIRPSLHFFSMHLSTALSIQGTVVIVGLVLGPVQAVAFSTIRTLCNIMKSVLTLVAQSAWPEMTAFASKGEFESLAILFRGILRTSLLGSTIAVFILHSWGSEIYRIWLGGAVQYDPGLIILFLIYLLQQVFWNTCSYPLMAANHHYGLSRVVLASSLAGIAMAYAGAKLGGTEGLVIGLLAAEVLLPFWLVPFLLSRYDSRFNPWFLLAELLPAFGTTVFVLLDWVLAIPAMIGLVVWWWRGVRPVLSRQFASRSSGNSVG